MDKALQCRAKNSSILLSSQVKISPGDTPSVDFPIIFSRVRSWPMPRSCDTSHLEIDRLLPSVHPLHPAVVAATTGEKKKHLQSGALLLPPAHHHFAFPSFSHLLSLVSSRSSNSFLLSPTYAFWICRSLVFFRSGLLSFALNPGTAASLFFSCSNSSGSGWSLTFSSAGKPDLLSSSLTPLGVLYSILNLCLTLSSTSNCLLPLRARPELDR